jgi:hypothetical protein
MSLMDVCPWAMWTMLGLTVVLLAMLLWRLIKVRTTAPGVFYFGFCALLFLLPCAGVLYELGAYIARFRWIEEGVVDPDVARHWEVFLSTTYYFVAFAAAAASLFVVLGLVVTGVHRLVRKAETAKAT